MNENEKLFIRHWRKLFDKCLSPDLLLSSFPHLTDGDEDISSAIRNLTTNEKKVDYFLRLLINSPEPGNFAAFINALRNCDEQKWIYKFLNGDFDDQEMEKCFQYIEQHSEIRKLFQILRDDFNVIDADVLIAFFTNHLTQEEIEELKCTFDRKGNGATVTAFLSVIMRKHPSWLKQFHEEISNQDFSHRQHGTLAAAFREFFTLEMGHSEDNTGNSNDTVMLNEEVVEPMDEGVTETENSFQEHPFTLIESFELLNVIEPCTSNNMSATGPSCSNIFPSTSGEEMVECSQNDMETSETTFEKFKLRNYQMELAEQAMKGENSLIVAPTGSGKTFVALQICKDHIEKRPDSKVVFMVPRVPLVKQQFELFKRHLGDEEGLLREISSDESLSAPVARLIRGHKITFMTPQILVNILRDKLIEISEVGLLVFDECHHTTKGDPYNSIMKIYHDSPNRKLPQIVGLTASPGVGGAKSDKAAIENIKTLLANLDVTTAPVQVIRHSEELKQYENEAKYDLVAVKRQPSEFRVQTQKIMDEIETKIKRASRNNENALKQSKMKIIAKARSGTQDYEAWVVELYKSSCLLQDADLSEKFMKYAQYLRVYNTSLGINDHVGWSEAMDYVTSELPRLITPATSTEKELKKLHDSQAPQASDKKNPMLEVLYEKLKGEFTQRPDSKCIIFVRTRAIATALITCLKESDLQMLLLNPKQLTGAGAAVEIGGMTKATQEDTISSFRDGRCKVIVATSVAEEGLDIKACNLIITYNYSTNEIGQVQRQGRGRAKGSKMIIIAYEDSDHIKRERNNKIRVEFTRDILVILRAMDSQQLANDIRKIQETLRTERKFESITSELQNSKKTARGNKIWELKCKGCKADVTTSDKIRHINKQHHVVVDPTFSAKAYFREIPFKDGKQIGFEEVLVGKVYCEKENCRYDWGVRMYYKGCPISVLKISAFVLVLGEQRMEKKKWKDSPFQVKNEFSVDDMKKMLEKENNVGIEDDDDEEDPFEQLAQNLLK